MENCMINDPLHIGKCDHCLKEQTLYGDSEGFYFCFNCWFLYHQYKHHRMTFNKLLKNTENN